MAVISESPPGWNQVHDPEFRYLSDQGLEGQALSLVEAQCQCEASALSPLRWTVIHRQTWAAKDQITGVLYHIERSMP